MLHPSCLFEFQLHGFDKASICWPVMSREHSSQMGTVDLIRKVHVAGPLAGPRHTCAHKCTQGKSVQPAAL